MRVAKVLKQGLAGMALVFLLAGPAMCLKPPYTYIEESIGEWVALDLSDENLKVVTSASEAEFDNEEARQDKRFMALLRAKLRLTQCNKIFLSDPSGFVALLCQDGQLLSPVGLASRAVEKIIRPLELEQLFVELVRYHEAVVNTPDWQRKFCQILSQDRVALDAGNAFHLAGFPEMEDNRHYTVPLHVELVDNSLYLSERDSSIEAWLYSFWMRRWEEDNMHAAWLAIDWLNKAIKQ